MVLVMGAGDDRLRLSDGFDDGVELLSTSGWAWKVWSRSAVMQHIALAHDAAGSRRRPRLGARPTRSGGVSDSGEIEAQTRRPYFAIFSKAVGDGWIGASGIRPAAHSSSRN